MRTIAMTLPCVLDDKDVESRVSDVIKSAEEMLKECSRSSGVESVYSAFADMVFHRDLLRCRVLNENSIHLSEKRFANM